MPEVVIPQTPERTIGVQKFQLPENFDKPETPAAPPTEAKPATEAVVTEPVEDKPEAEKETTGKDPVKSSTRRFERRIDRLTREAAESRAAKEQADKRIAELEAKQNPVPSGEPEMDKYTDIKEYAKAYAKWESDNAVKAYESKQKEVQKQQEVNKLKADWDSKASEAEDKYEDFADKVGDLRPTTPWAVALMEEENGPDIAYYLANHRKEAEKIFALNPFAQSREIGKLSVKLASAPEKPKQPSKAPAPISPVQTAATTSDDDPFKPMAPEQYMKLGAKKFRGR
jgi:hypothetical protein